MRAPAPIELNSENSRRRRWLVPESRDPSRRDVLAVGSSGGALPALPGWCSTKCVRKDAPSMGGDGVHLQPEPRSRLAEAAARGAYTPGGAMRPAGAYHADMADCSRFVVPTDQLPSCLVISLRVLLMLMVLLRLTLPS